MKKIIFVTQSKGGTGKSALTNSLAQQYPKALIIDMDDEFRTISCSLTDRNTIAFSFYDKLKNIDRSLFDTFIEMVEGVNEELLICDLSPAISQQLVFILNPKYDEFGEAIEQFLAHIGAELELYIVVGGGNIFEPTTRYLRNIYPVVNQRFPIIVYKNAYFPFSEEQDRLLEDYATEHSLEVIPLEIVTSFNIARLSRS
jgi:hypothetical protein